MNIKKTLKNISKLLRTGGGQSQFRESMKSMNIVSIIDLDCSVLQNG